jgi:predicted MPP superfamily phosphohydrolase
VFEKLLAVSAKILLVMLILGIILTAYLYLENSMVAMTQYGIYSEKIPAAFNNYSIVLISDHHNSNNIKKVTQKVEEIKPKIIVIAGDSINMHDENHSNALMLAEHLMKIAPVYFTSGNHETWSGNENDFLDSLKSSGVTVLNNTITTITYKNSEINLIGFKDVVYSDDNMRKDILDNELNALYNKVENKDLFNILVFHKANLFDWVSNYPFDLVLSGHLHGGQINLPIIKEHMLSTRFLTKKYSKGYYRKGNCQMVVSGGTEKNFKRPRIFNPPEVIEVVLKPLD